MVQAAFSTTLDAAGLRESLLACRKCALPPGSHPIASVYQGQSFLLLGQAPGKEEMLKGYPFAGAAGKTLFRWFAEAGLGDEAAVRRRMYFTSLARCWPGSRPGSKDDLPPSRQMVANCAAHIAAERDLVRPRMVVAVGAMAAKALLRKSRTLGELVGVVHTANWGEGELPVVVLPHPSGLSRWLNDPRNLTLHAESLRILRQAWTTPGDPAQNLPAGA
jgi:uracil-DNA glycosylase